MVSVNNTDDEFARKRWEMVEKQLISRGIKERHVVDAFLNVPRHRFVPPELVDSAYYDGPLPIGMEQTISQPYIVALMTEVADVHKGDKVLEVGTGSGYQTAILAEIGCEVYTIEIIPELAERARHTLTELGYRNIHFRIGDGNKGWEEHAPYDAVIVTAAPDHIPDPLVEQLKVGGRLVIPVGSYEQELLLLVKEEKGVTIRHITPVRFVPMKGDG